MNTASAMASWVFIKHMKAMILSRVLFDIKNKSGTEPYVFTITYSQISSEGDCIN